ncbi:protein MpPKC12 [Marchantia polymorpha subsp. ruderalis]|uniref:Stress-response A/B barrel domain-containing protein n=2 Tax=Marchantia polymorpha TaxID=3197 RepID=A0A679DYB1_MARPO|nr:hypothetical protein MARPO_0058s0001 [Marchantia polymorpha]BBN20778.1 hypothetical protein Mp_zg01330 [Marchantia polymorpha subsp. ruderalis]|eukprot:PTQ37209.1 hypothetical protein MARPO_0058s0001 [Marchantia polymorpha]
MAETIKHVVLLKFKDELTAEKIQQLIDDYAALPAKIDVMKGFEWGTDVSTENLHQGYTHAFISTFDSKEGRDAYVVHEVHQEYAGVLIANIEKICVFDYSPTVVPIPVKSS